MQNQLFMRTLLGKIKLKMQSRSLRKRLTKNLWMPGFAATWCNGSRRIWLPWKSKRRIWRLLCATRIQCTRSKRINTERRRSNGCNPKTYLIIWLKICLMRETRKRNVLRCSASLSPTSRITLRDGPTGSGDRTSWRKQLPMKTRMLMRSRCARSSCSINSGMRSFVRRWYVPHLRTFWFITAAVINAYWTIGERNATICSYWWSIQSY